MAFFRKHKSAAILIGIPLSLILILILTFCVLTVIPLFEGTDKTPVTGSDSWMERLPDDMPVSEVVIPGTHDSASRYVALPFFSKCQTLDIAEQLEAGYRFLDIRLNAREDGSMLLMHGFTHCRNGLMPWSGNLDLNKVLDLCYSFLKAHPTEFIIFSVKQEIKDVSIDKFERILKTFIDKDPDFWLLSEDIASVGEARGKLVLLRRYPDMAELASASGMSFMWLDQNNRQDTHLAELSHENGTYTLTVQDRYKYDSDDKWNAFLSTLKASQAETSDPHIFMNYLSTTGNTVYGHPYKYAKKLNSKFISDTGTDLSGWIIVDFATPKIAEKIYLENFE